MVSGATSSCSRSVLGPAWLVGKAKSRARRRGLRMLDVNRSPLGDRLRRPECCATGGSGACSLYIDPLYNDRIESDEG
jgi:hypothetical protein